MFKSVNAGPLNLLERKTRTRRLSRCGFDGAPVVMSSYLLLLIILINIDVKKP